MPTKIGPIYDGPNDAVLVITALTSELNARLRERGGAAEQLLKLAANVIRHDAGNQERTQEVVDQLTAELQKYVPPFCYFGAHPDEPTRIGYWPDWPAILDLAPLPEGAATHADGWVRVVDQDHNTVALWHNGKKEVDLAQKAD